MLYFAYGSNLLLQRMIKRCPSAKPYSKATLNFWRLTYKQNFRGNGVATIVKNDTKTGAVYGALYDISDDEIATLDRFEGHPHIYKKYFITVDTNYGKRRVLVYIMNDRFICCPPQKKYLDIIKGGYEDWMLDVDKLVKKPTDADYAKFGKYIPPKRRTSKVIKLDQNKSLKFDKFGRDLLDDDELEFLSQLDEANRMRENQDYLSIVQAVNPLLGGE